MDGATAGHDDPRHLLERLEEALTTAAGPTDGSTDDSSRPARRARCARPGLARHVTIGLVRFVSWLAVNAVALAVVLWLIPGIHLDGPTHGSAEIRHKLVPLLIVALILGTVSRFVKPVLTILSLPLIIVTLGLFLLVVNAAMLGLTAVAVQKQLGVDQPDYGMLFSDMDVPEGIPISLDQVIQPKVEAEIAIVVGRDLPHPDLTTAEMIRAVEYVVPAIEIVDSRVANWDIRIWDTVADNASSGLFVLGAVPRKLDALDLRECGMVMEVKGEPISVGAGIACLGSPITAALWLARVMAKVGRPLLEGDVILSGALGPMAGVARGDVVEARINGVGTVRAAFAAEAG